MRCGRPSAAAAVSTSPASMHARMYVDENVIPSSVIRSSPSTPNPNFCPSWVSSATSPLALWPNVKLRPTTTSAACSRSTSTSCANSAGSVRASSAVKGNTQKASTPSPATSSARRRRLVSRAGWLPGRISSAGCGSNVTSAVGRPRSRPRSTARPMSCWWPRCTPSNTPTVTTLRPQPLGTDSTPPQRCTSRAYGTGCGAPRSPALPASRSSPGGVSPRSARPPGSPSGAGQEESTHVNAVPSGLVGVDKPAGLTSHDVVARLRRILGTRKIGHAGTLDPMATGVLVCGVGRGTKLLGHLALDTKAYTATIRLGAATTTDDAEGEIVSTAGTGAVDDAVIAAGMAALTGAIEQVPSSVSAIKIDGKRAYARVRAGEEVVIPARPVTVSQFRLLARRGDDLDVVVDCSSGTYVRALARDLGSALGVGGHLTALRRTRVGPFTLEHARTLEQLESAPELTLPLDQAVGVAFPRRDLDAALAADIAHGRPLPAAGVGGTYGVFAPDGRALALVSERGELARPVVVLAPA